MPRYSVVWFDAKMVQMGESSCDSDEEEGLITDWWFADAQQQAEDAGARYMSCRDGDSETCAMQRLSDDDWWEEIEDLPTMN